jgi:hypothetical protein
MHQKRNSNVVLNPTVGRFNCSMSPVTVLFNPVTVADNGKKSVRQRIRKNSFE